jgi:hypothetical protein
MTPQAGPEREGTTGMAAVTPHECLFPVQPPAGSWLNPGPCECGQAWAQTPVGMLLATAAAYLPATPEGTPR